jgi:LmbE family N-acetylglucosaminyl deacetylase
MGRGMGSRSGNTGVPALQPGEPVLVVSPHLDDGVFSCAYFLRSHPSASVVTVFAGAPDVDHDGYNSMTTGEGHAPDAIAVRREEDRVALGELDARPIWLDLLEAEYSAYRPPTDYLEAISEEIVRVIGDVGAASVIAPLGLVHHDHVAVSNACRAIWQRLDVEWYAYLDLPYGAAHPRLVARRLRLLRRHARLVELQRYTGDSGDKQHLMSLYGSQFEVTRTNYGEAFDATMTGDERYWRVLTTH